MIGRDSELGVARRFADPGHRSDPVLLVRGEAGMGKTAVLEYLADEARRVGVQVVHCVAVKAESDVPFAGLNQLLLRVRDHVDVSTVPHAEVLRAIADLNGVPSPSDPRPRLALGALLRAMGKSRSLLLVVDDAHWLDRPSWEAMTFAARRFDPKSAAIVLACRSAYLPDGLARAMSRIDLEPLAPRFAEQLIDRGGRSLRGLMRERVLHDSAGNPQALIEFGNAAHSLPDDASAFSGPLLSRTSLIGICGDEIASLPEATMDQLLLLSAADLDDVEILCSKRYLDLEALSRAELVGLLRITAERVEFVNPMIRSAVYYSASFVARASVHRRLASVLVDRPHRRAWHLGMTTVGADEAVAALLESTSSLARRRKGYAAATAAMERAAVLSADSCEQARRLSAAAALARYTGDAGWSGSLAERAVGLAVDSRYSLAAQNELGWALTWTSNHDAALSILLSVVGRTPVDDPAIRWLALRDAGLTTFLSGDGAVRARLRQALETPPVAWSSSAGASDATRVGISAEARLWATTVTDLRGGLASRSELRRIAENSFGIHARGTLGATAWLVDESEMALNLLTGVRHDSHAPGTPGRHAAGTLVGLGWTQVDLGRWDDALVTAEELERLAVVSCQPLLSAVSHLITGTVLALRGTVHDARKHVVSASGTLHAQATRAAGAWWYRAAGLVSLADGAETAAYRELRHLFADDGTPFHYHGSYQGLADLAIAAARAGLQDETRPWIERVIAKMDGVPSPRLAQLIGHARALVANPEDAADHFAATLSDPAGERWPFERAQLRLHYGAWLRRQRKVRAAKEHLVEAAAIFERLGAEGWHSRAMRELRATGVRASSAARSGEPLSPQQMEVVQLAGEGLTNREIAAELNISPRTVGAHLYQSFPKLGISNRRQIRGVLGIGGEMQTDGPDG